MTARKEKNYLTQHIEKSSEFWPRTKFGSGKHGDQIEWTIQEVG